MIAGGRPRHGQRVAVVGNSLDTTAIDEEVTMDDSADSSVLGRLEWWPAQATLGKVQPPRHLAVLYRRVRRLFRR